MADDRDPALTDLFAPPDAGAAGAAQDGAGATPLFALGPKDAVPDPYAAWAQAAGFKAATGEVLLCPTAEGGVGAALIGLGEETPGAPPLAGLGDGPYGLPAGAYALQGGHAAEAAALAWALGGYRFRRYKSEARAPARLALPGGAPARAAALAEGVWLTRDLVNTPAADMGPIALQRAVETLAGRHGAALIVTEGEALLDDDLGMIHAVGRAAAEAPRLLDLTWGDEDAPKVTLVGKGVCFDTGGLDVKPPRAMRNMKKDMGGAATALGLAHMIMAQALPVRLRVLIPAVENAIGPDSFRPGDVLLSRKGKTVEIGDTDAEGRLVLADALTLADAEAPEILIDLATLTGAARVAMGPELAPFYTTDDAFAAALEQAARTEGDPVWRMPLWTPYAKGLTSKVADLCNITSDGMAGSVTAALFLKEFVEKAAVWAHFDIFAWTPTAKPGRPEGGACQSARALFATLEARFGAPA